MFLDLSQKRSEYKVDRELAEIKHQIVKENECKKLTDVKSKALVESVNNSLLLQDKSK